MDLIHIKLFCCSCYVNVSDTHSDIHTSKIVNESHPHLSLNCLISCVTACTYFNM